MYIKKLFATFGSLNGKTLELKSGLNIVYGKNEAGKSTWSAFIRAMFYGISTREKAKAGYLPDKERYLPWSGDAMYGRMELEKNGDELELERSSGKTGVFSKASAKNISRGEEAPLGEELVGVARGVYDRCAFIGQAKISIDGDADTEKKILSLASSGEEEVSAGEVNARLEKKQREIRSPRGLGELPRLEAEAEGLSRELEFIREAGVKIAEAEESLSANKRMEKLLARDLAIAEAERAKKAREYVKRAGEELLKCETAAKSCEGYPSREAYEGFREEMRKWQELCHTSKDAAQEYERITEAHSASIVAVEQDKAFAKVYPPMAEEQAKSDKEALVKLQSKRVSPIGIALIIAAVLCAVSGFFVGIYALVPAALFTVIGVFLIAAPAEKREKKRKMSELAEKYGEASTEAIDAVIKNYLSRAEEATRLGDMAAKAYMNANSTERDAALAGERLKLTLEHFAIPAEDIEQGEKLLRSLAEKREETNRAVREARARVEAIEKTTADEAAVIEYEESEIPREDADTIRNKLLGVQLAIKNTELALAALRERASGRDEKKISETLESVEAKKAELELRFSAYSLAMKTIASSDLELRSRFSPEVEARAGEIFKALTGGSFEVVRIKSNDFDMEVATGEASARRDKLSLSQGTFDELYFALRLALCELILPETEAPPMVLDDVFVNFDDERCRRALELLAEMAKSRQIILFSCHTREAHFMKDAANIVEI